MLTFDKDGLCITPNVKKKKAFQPIINVISLEMSNKPSIYISGSDRMQCIFLTTLAEKVEKSRK